jgi:TPR repeat protein
MSGQPTPATVRRALRLGAKFDPGFLSRAGVRGAPGDPTRAASWYRRALDLGEAAAAERLKNLDPAAH